MPLVTSEKQYKRFLDGVNTIRGKGKKDKGVEIFERATCKDSDVIRVLNMFVWLERIEVHDDGEIALFDDTGKREVLTVE